MWIADVARAGLVAKQASIGSVSRIPRKRAERKRMLPHRTAPRHRLLKARLPEKVQALVRADAVAARLAEQVCAWLPAAGSAPPGLFERSLFRMRMRGGWLSAPAYLLRLSVSPTEEDWKVATEKIGMASLTRYGRPFRLARKVSSLRHRE